QGRHRRPGLRGPRDVLRARIGPAGPPARHRRARRGGRVLAALRRLLPRGLREQALLAGPVIAVIDLHCHGGGGAAFGTGVDETLRALEAHAAHGTAGIVASLVTAPASELARQLDVLREASDADARLLGAHLEGPFLAPERKGAHDAAHLSAPTPTMGDDLLAAGQGLRRQVTSAPELPGAVAGIAAFAAAGVVPAVGHPPASASLAAEAFDAGARLVTHAFNAMPGITARDPGPVGAALADERVAIEVIAD